MDIIRKLEKRKQKTTVKTYLKDESYLKGEIPISIISPSNTKEVSEILGFCNRKRIAVVVRGAGSSLTGSSIPIKDGIAIEMSKFNKILETHIEDQYVIVEPGITIDKLNKHLSKYNYFYPPDPASSAFATVGGTISTNAGGLHAIMYGSTKEWVLGMEVVLPNGNVIWTGSRATKRSIGYDLTALMIASEGTLGITTKAILKIWPKPEALGRISSYYSKIEEAAKAIGELKKNGIIPLIAEFMDKSSMQLMHDQMKINFPKEAKYMTIIDIASSKESLDRILSDTEKILKKFNPILIKISKSKQEMEKTYKARKYLFNATLKKAEKEHKSVIIADVVVPSSELPSALYEIEHEIRKQKLEVILFGHMGDGNVHANIIADVKREKEAIDKLQETFGDIALKHRGSVSGEHGIGLIKKKLLLKEMAYHNSSYSIKLMKEIKKSFDPNGILNKGKIFD